MISCCSLRMESAMISISNVTISSKATAGTVVGTLNLLNGSAQLLTANFILDETSAGFFAISGQNLVNLTPIPPGYYSVSVSAVGTHVSWLDSGIFVLKSQ